MKDLSIIIPTHARPRELRRCLSSIKMANIKNYEVILISDVFHQETHDVAHGFLGSDDCYIVRNGRPGPAASRNFGLQHATGRHILFFDDDDALPENNYQDFLNFAMSNPSAAIYADVELIKEDRDRDVVFPDAPARHSAISYDFSSIYIKNFIYTQACLFPVNAIRDLRQDTHMRVFEDWDFLLAVASKLNFIPVNYVAALIYKDYVNSGNRRSTTGAATGFDGLLDYLYVYRRWPAPGERLKSHRSDFLKQAGLFVPEENL